MEGEEASFFALVDGNAGLGHWVGRQAVQLGIDKAKNSRYERQMYQKGFKNKAYKKRKK